MNSAVFKQNMYIACIFVIEEKGVVLMNVCHVGTAHRRYDYDTDISIFYKECTSLANAGYDVRF